MVRVAAFFQNSTFQLYAHHFLHLRTKPTYLRMVLGIEKVVKG